MLPKRHSQMEISSNSPWWKQWDSYALKKANLFKSISLAPNTTACRPEDIRSNIVLQIAYKKQDVFKSILSHLMNQMMSVIYQLLALIYSWHQLWIYVTQKIASEHSAYNTVTGEGINTWHAQHSNWIKHQCLARRKH